MSKTREIDLQQYDISGKWLPYFELTIRNKGDNIYSDMISITIDHKELEELEKAIQKIRERDW